jgi:putative membrane protein
MLSAIELQPWQFRAHPQVWVLMLGIIALGGWAVRVIGPKVVPAGEVIVTGKEKAAFIGAVVAMWIAADWPMHDIGENYLYFVHMIQHLVISFVVAPLFLIAMPRWFADLIFTDDGVLSRIIRTLSRPVPAGGMFTAVTVFLHWPRAVQLSTESGAFHYSMHVLLFVTALFMWVPICGPFPERRISPPGQMVYLFLQSIVPTVPAGWLTFAEGAVYKTYDTEARLLGLTVTHDQQLAGGIMKIVGGFFLWGVIAVIFFRWASREDIRDQRPIVVVRPDGTVVVPGRDEPPAAAADELEDDLTFEHVAAEFERLGPPPVEAGPHRDLD